MARGTGITTARRGAQWAHRLTPPTDRLATETTRLTPPAIEVDTTVGKDALVERVTRIFGL